VTARANSDFVHVGDANYYGTSSPKPRNWFCVSVCDARDELRSMAVCLSQNFELDLDSDRNAVEETTRLSRFPPLSTGLSFCSGTGAS
jgi:hypothetical protein